jgi:hypothetical protein
MQLNTNYFISSARQFYNTLPPVSRLCSYAVTYLSQGNTLRYVSAGMTVIALPILYMIYRLLFDKSKKKQPAPPPPLVTKTITVAAVKILSQPAVPRPQPLTLSVIGATPPPVAPQQAPAPLAISTALPSPVPTAIPTPEVEDLTLSFQLVPEEQPGVFVDSLGIYHKDVGKLMAYEHCLNQLRQLAGTPPKGSFTDPPKKAAVWVALLDALKYKSLKSVDAQYHTFVIALRNAVDTFSSQPADPRTQWISVRSYHRFHSVNLFSYAEHFILQNLPGYKFPQLTLGKFYAELKNINNLLDQSPAQQSLSWWERNGAKAAGTFNIDFDPLAFLNIPYVYGTWTLNGKEIRVLRHGVPIYFDNKWSWFVENKPIINSDFVSSVDYAGKTLKSTIGHTILENPEKKWLWGDESSHVETRKALKRDHFVSLGLCLDNFLFKKDQFKATAIADLRKTVIDAIINNTLGFHISDKIKAAIHDKQNDSAPWVTFGKLFDEIHNIYFRGKTTINSFKEQVAFTTLFYVHILHAFGVSQELAIKILEALCKDDIDRGNAIKTILMLHFFYLTEKISQENLQNILIHAVMAPWMVKKQPIDPKREILIEAVCEIMALAFSTTYREKNLSPYLKLDPKNCSFTVERIPNQTTFPTCSSASTAEMYQDYFEASLGVPLPLFSGNIITTIAKGINTANRVDVLQTIKQQIDNTPLTLLLNGQPVQPSFLAIRQFLTNSKLSTNDITNVMCSISPYIIDETTKLLEKLLKNPALGYDIAPHTGLKNITLNITAKNGVAKLEFMKAFTLTRPFQNPIHFCATITIDDHRKGQAFVTLLNVPS